MKETSFIEQNKEKWQRFEEIRKDKSANPDELSNLFVEITDDLSYARTFYPRRSVRVYLNNLAQSVFNSLYKLKKDPFGNFLRFWKIGLPLEMYHARKYFFTATLFFIVAMLIGVISTMDDISFADVMLSPEYTYMTEKNIEKGDPMAVYKQMDELPMFFFIFLNNIQVAFFCFVLGVLFCVGTGYFLFYNGVMLGAFQTFFYVKELAVGKGLFLTSVLTIWIHATFEILSIILAGAAGFVIGMHLLYPGTYTRVQSFQIGAKRGLKMMMGVSVFLFLAAILESYVTRHTEMPVAVKWTIILSSLGIFVFYFIVYPFFVHAKYGNKYDAAPKPIYRPMRIVELYKLKQINEIVADTFILFKQVYQKIGKLLWMVIIPLNLGVIYFVNNDGVVNLDYYDLFSFSVFYSIFDTGNGNLIFVLGTILLFALTSSAAIKGLRKMESGSGKEPLLPVAMQWLLNGALFYAFLLLIFGLMKVAGEMAFFVFVILFPLAIYLPVGFSDSRNKGFERIKNPINNYFANIGNSYGLFLITALVMCGFFFLIHSVAFYIIESLLNWHMITSVDNYGYFLNFFHSAIYVVFLQHFFIFLVLAFGVYHYVNIETKESVSLFKRLKKFGMESKTHERNSQDED